MVSAHRPPSETNRGVSAGVRLAASVPAENRGWAAMAEAEDEKGRKREEMRDDGRRRRIAEREEGGVGVDEAAWTLAVSGWMEDCEW